MKIQFSNTEKLDRWLGNVVQASKYDLYYASGEMRLYAIKNVSTEPRLHAFVDRVEKDDVIEVADNYGIMVTEVKRFNWKHEGGDSPEL
jgi:hypothetical protein